MTPEAAKQRLAEGEGRLMADDVLMRFAAKYVVQPDTECWHWTASGTPEGYGQLSVAGRRELVHRLSYQHYVGPIPKGLQIDHLCRNRRCANPNHLDLVTSRVNTLRGRGPSARNARKTHCLRGHPFDEGNTYYHRGRRLCRRCDALRTVEYNARKRAPLASRSCEHCGAFFMPSRRTHRYCRKACRCAAWRARTVPVSD